MAEYRKLGSNGLLYEALVDEIEQMVVHGKLKAGDSLPPQDELATSFGVSRTVVREAVQILVAKQLVSVQRGKGMVVSHPSSASVAEPLSLLLKLGKASLPQLTELRFFVEPEMAALAASRGSAQQLKTIERIEAAYRSRAEGDKGGSSADAFEKYAMLDQSIHRAIWDAAHNDVAKMVLESVQGLFRESLVETYSLDGALERTVEDHNQIARAILARDAQEARLQMRAHLNQTRDDQSYLAKRRAGRRSR